MEKPLIQHEYTEPRFNPLADIVRVETIFGTIPQVTADPTWTPRTFKDGFALGNIAGTRKLYIYDFTGQAWYKVSLTAV